MAMTLARALLPLLAVTMTTAAPLEPATGEEVAVAATGDNHDTVRIAKRAEEEIVFGNQQNSARLGTAKKSLQLDEQHIVSQDNANVMDAAQQQDLASNQQQGQGEPQPEQPSAAADEAQPTVEEKHDKEENGQEAEKAEEQPEANKGVEQMASTAEAESSDKKTAVSEDQLEKVQEPQSAADQTNPPDTQTPDTPLSSQVLQHSSEEAEKDEEDEEEEEAEQQPVPVEGGEHGTVEEEQEEEAEVNNLPLEPLQEGGVLSDPQGSSDNSGNDETPHPSDTAAAEITADDHQLPEVDNRPDPEAVLQAVDQPQDVTGDEDDVENLLNDLHDQDVPVAEGPEDEGTAEKELMQVNSHVIEGPQAGATDYRQSLLKYILSHSDEYGRLASPQSSSSMYRRADPYYLQRQRRSLAVRRSRLPHIHRRLQLSTERELSRAKRTKRDLFDDDLYYNVGLPYARQRQQEQEEAEKDAELQEFITYLMALHPALFSNERLSPQLPAYLWQQASDVPEEEEEEEEDFLDTPYWEEAPAPYEEEPRAEWGQPELEVPLPPPPPQPAWEPSFYPEEMEEEEPEEAGEPGFYPMMAKRELMSFVPGQRRKRYFFPFAREPYTHWGAFVPSQDKRQWYGDRDPYSRLRELAMVLAEDRRQPSYLDTMDEYKKK